MAPGIIYTSCVLGAIALYVLLIPGRPALKPVGIVLGLGALGWVFKASIEAVAVGVGCPEGPGVLFYFFSGFAECMFRFSNRQGCDNTNRHKRCHCDIGNIPGLTFSQVKSPGTCDQ